jgi:hypothetical protein
MKWKVIYVYVPYKLYGFWRSSVRDEAFAKSKLFFMVEYLQFSSDSFRVADGKSRIVTEDSIWILYCTKLLVYPEINSGRVCSPKLNPPRVQ